VVPQMNGSKKVVLGIYKVEKGTLTVCEARPDRARPARVHGGQGRAVPVVGGVPAVSRESPGLAQADWLPDEVQ